jgi:hypothetical protein
MGVISRALVALFKPSQLPVVRPRQDVQILPPQRQEDRAWSQQPTYSQQRQVRQYRRPRPYMRLVGECTLCGRVLTDPVSIQRGLGPECEARARYYGWID